MLKQSYLVIFLAYGCSLEASGNADRDATGIDSGPPGEGADGAGGDGWPDDDPGIARDAGGPSGPADAGSGPPPPAPDAASPSMDANVPDPMPDPEDAGLMGFTPDPGKVGSPCERSSDCSGSFGNCLLSVRNDQGQNIEIPNGYCTHFCGSCDDDVERCVDAVCVRTCEGDSDCRAPEGYRCLDGLCTVPGL